MEECRGMVRIERGMEGENRTIRKRIRKGMKLRMRE